jgi:hypothetical protein
VERFAVGFILVGVLSVIYYYVRRARMRRMIMGLNWPAGLSNKKLAEICRRYLAAYGVESTIEADQLFDLSIPRRQFSNNLGTLLVACRDRNYIGGGTQFRDMRAACLNTHIGARPLIITPSAITSDLYGHSLTTEVPMLSLRDLPDFASALQGAKSSDWGGYKGASAAVTAALSRLVPSNERIISEQPTTQPNGLP